MCHTIKAATVAFLISSSMAQSEVIFNVDQSVHIGDENISAWSRLYGKCVHAELPEIPSQRSLVVSYEPYGLEGAYISYNDVDYGLPAQAAKEGTRRPNYWGRRSKITVELASGAAPQSLHICANNIAEFDASADYDDFMVRNLVISVEAMESVSIQNLMTEGESRQTARPPVARPLATAPSSPATENNVVSSGNDSYEMTSRRVAIRQKSFGLYDAELLSKSLPPTASCDEVYQAYQAQPPNIYTDFPPLFTMHLFNTDDGSFEFTSAHPNCRLWVNRRANEIGANLRGTLEDMCLSDTTIPISDVQYDGQDILTSYRIITGNLSTSYTVEYESRSVLSYFKRNINGFEVNGVNNTALCLRL